MCNHLGVIIVGSKGPWWAVNVFINPAQPPPPPPQNPTKKITKRLAIDSTPPPHPKLRRPAEAEEPTACSFSAQRILASFLFDFSLPDEFDVRAVLLRVCLVELKLLNLVLGVKFEVKL